jgi:hypothetical protein
MFFIAFKGGVDHFDCRWRCKHGVHWGQAWIDQYGECHWFEEGVHIGGHREASRTVDKASGTFQLLQNLDDMLAEGTELAEVRAWRHQGGLHRNPATSSKEMIIIISIVMDDACTLGGKKSTNQ